LSEGKKLLTFLITPFKKNVNGSPEDAASGERSFSGNFRVICLSENLRAEMIFPHAGIHLHYFQAGVLFLENFLLFRSMQNPRKSVIISLVVRHRVRKSEHWPCVFCAVFQSENGRTAQTQRWDAPFFSASGRAGTAAEVRKVWKKRTSPIW
jgi:hypothetical protein